jgi:Cu2+-exporting ATPase
VDTVVFDKTGTLTHDRLALSEVRVRDGVSASHALEWAAGLAQASLHPVSRAVVQAWQTRHPDLPVPTWAAIEEHAGQGMSGISPTRGLLRLGSAAFCGWPAPAVQPTTAPQAHLCDAQGWLATLVFDEGVREDAAAAIATLHREGITPWLLSGDRLEAATRVAQQVGIHPMHVIASASPEDKLRELVSLQTQGHRVAMVGDGLNDGPVLARAHASFALGSAAPLAQAQSDVVIQSGRIQDVVSSLQQARATMRVVRQNLVWALGYNAVSVPLALAGYMPPWAAGLGMAISSFLVIGNALRLNRNDTKS